MKKIILAICLCIGFALHAQEEKKVLNIIAIGAHPDDCDFKFGGTATLMAKMGHKVKFLAITNGDAGHQTEGGGALGKRRRAEAKKAGEIFGVEYDALDNHDGELVPSLDIRHQVIRKIREWDADVVLGLRPNDYHPDHRNAGVLVQDAAYLVIVPNVTPDTPALKKNPIFLYMNDGFQKPYPFTKDVAVVIDELMDTKIHALAAHESQVFEWMPWLDGIDLSEIPKGQADRIIWMNKHYKRERTWKEDDIAAIEKWYPNMKAADAKHAEFFEICEYGKQPTEEDIKAIFPMLGVNKK